MTFLPSSQFFPPAELADPDGLVLFGGRLDPDWLLDAYRHAIFPWPVFENLDLLAWWSPNPRAIIEFDEFHVPRRLQRTCRSGRFQVTCDQDFAAVIRGCAEAQDRLNNTWLLPEMIDAYEQLHAMGYAHSIEVWQGGKLVGGTYGMALHGLFSAESKFYYQRDASKVALVYLVEHIRRRGFQLLDIQQLTEHTERMGAKEIPRTEYLVRLAEALHSDVTFGDHLEVGDFFQRDSTDSVGMPG